MPEDFVLRGQLWTDGYFPDNWFTDGRIDDEERALELPSFRASRLERVLWIAQKISSEGRWILFNDVSHKFVLTGYARELSLPQPTKQLLPPMANTTSSNVTMCDDHSSPVLPIALQNDQQPVTPLQVKRTPPSRQERMTIRAPMILKRGTN